MAPNTVTLTQSDCETAAPAFKDDVPRARLISIGKNLYLQVSPSKLDADGNYSVSRSWLFRASLDGKPVTKGLGPLAYVGKPDNSENALTLEDAKLEARGLAKDIKNKINPVEQERQARKERAQEREKAERAVVTFAQAAAGYAADKIAPRSGAAYETKWLRMLEIHAGEINKVPVGDVDRAQIKRVLKPLWDARKTKTGKDLRGRIEQVLTWAIAEGHRSEDAGNPATWTGNLEASFPKPSDVRPIVNHPAVPYARAAAFMAELRSKDWLGAKATQFAILTVSRAQEVIGMRWEEVNLNATGGPIWTVPASRMKKRRVHIVPLNRAAVKLLEAQKGGTSPLGFKLVFPGAGGEELAENSLLKSVQRVDPTVTQHGFRSTFADWRGQQTDFSSELAEFALAHVKKGVEGAYHRDTMVEKRRPLMEAWADFLDGAAIGKAEVA
jgi:integrase